MGQGLAEQVLQQAWQPCMGSSCEFRRRLFLDGRATAFQHALAPHPGASPYCLPQRKKAQKERRNQRRAEKRRKSQEGPLQLFTKRAREAMARGEYEPRAPDEEGQDARDPETAPQEAQAEAVDSHSPAGGEEQNSGASALPTKVKGRGSTRRGLYGDEAEVAVESEAAYGFGVEDTSFGGVRPGLQSRLGAPRTLSARLGERAQ